MLFCNWSELTPACVCNFAAMTKPFLSPEVHKPSQTQLHSVASILTKAWQHMSGMVLHLKISNCCTHLETKADGRDDTEHRGPRADPAHRQEETHRTVIFQSSQMPQEEEEISYY